MSGRFILLCALSQGCIGVFPGDWETWRGLHQLHIEEVDPNEGPLDGGNEVIIRGGGFAGTVSVEFGYSAADVEVLDEQNLWAVAPWSGLPGSVDVVVFANTRVAELTDGYRYLDEDTGASDAIEGGLRPD